jgi:glutathione S-transferase
VNRLVTIPFSHYCEKARWALDRAGIAYREEPHLPIFSWTASIPAGRSRTVPVFVTDGEVFTDSTEILRWVDREVPSAGLFPAEHDAEVSRLEELFDRRLGPAARRLAYFHMTADRGAMRRLFSKNAPLWELGAGRLFQPLLVGVIKRGLKVDAKGASRSKLAVHEVFGEVARLLEDGRRWLTGDRFTAADLTFAALASPLLVPEGLEAHGLDLEAAPDAMRAMVAEHRDAPAGRFGLRAYAERRKAGNSG